MLRRLGLVIFALLPLVAAAFVSARLADRIGLKLGALLDQTLGVALRLPPPAGQEPLGALAPSAPPPGRSADQREPRRETADAKPSRASRRAADRAPQRGLRVSAEVVLRLAQSGARPAGTPVPALQGCPAGLRLSGVGALGVGLRDGDVLTHAAGRPASSRADVVGAVIGARGARQREVSGKFCRGGEAWNLVVEQPYLESSASAEGSRPRVAANRWLGRTQGPELPALPAVRQR